MPATEQTWRNLNTMHVVFGLASLGMLITTILMLAGDNVREWKAYQRQFRNIETWTAESRVAEEQTSAFAAKKAELDSALKAIEAQPPKAELVDAFLAVADAKAKDPNYGYNIAALKQARDNAVRTNTASDQARTRAALSDAMNVALTRAKFVEAKEQRDLKGMRAKFDEVNSNLAIAIDEGKSKSEVASHQSKVDDVKKQVAAQVDRAESSRTHRVALQEAIAAVEADKKAAEKAIADHEGIVKRLQTAVYERGDNLGKKFLEMPVIDAFGRPLKVEQIWLPTLTLNNNFRDVARFDRCTTCHQGIDKTAAGSAVAAGYERTSRTQIALATPKDPKDPTGSGKPNDGTPTLGSVYGIALASQGVVNANDVTVEVVWPKTLAALAGLKSGDVIEMVADAKVKNRGDVESRLLKTAKWGQPVQLTVRRGVEHPFSSHPRLDLFVGSLSPHKMADFGCTICHEGQGSATQFKWVSHTPNDPKQAHEWAREHGWFNNHHWILPMLPERFNQSSCLKCHHDVVELQPSERFPEPPAAKLVQGWETIKDIGCFGCHEINGYDGPSKRRGPDLRPEPNHASLAQQLLSDTTLSPEQRRLAQEVATHPDRSNSRKLLAENLLTSAAAKEGKLNPASKKMAEMLAADDETPGKLRKVGPSLRYLASKVDESFLYDWVREPKHFRPSTKMPQFFGLHDHLGENDESAKYEPVEILAVTKYLLTASQKFDYTPAATGVESPSVERGKLAFQTRGCLACHQHPDVKEGKAVHGPDLAKLGAKLTGDKGGKWLYTWLRDPTNYHARTSMPNLFLDPQKGTDGKMVDPAADIVAYLLSQRDWQPKGIPSISPGALDELVEKYLKGAFTTVDAKKFAKDGIPAERGARVAGDEAMLVAGRGDLQNQKLLYLGKKSIGRLGCAGCHDVPGFEDAKSIGAGLADWGRKEPSKLAFEQVVTYVQGQLAGHGGAHGADGHGSSGHGGHPDLVHMDPDQGFFLEALFGHHREGFIWQKLREPRSYDYKKVENKDYLDRLRMPKFNLTDAQREAIMTFVLGLVAEPPAAKYVYKGTPRNVAIQRGRDVLEKFNCVGCHTIDMEKWEFDYEPGKLASPQPFDPAKEYAFVQPHFTPNEIEASKKVDRRGLGHAVVSGMPNPEVQEDEDGKPVWFFKPWQSVAINGNIFRAGGQEVEIPQANITAKHPPYGGDLARLLHPVVFELEKKVNPNAKASDAWGWVPPPLVNEGQKVRAEWLYEFLMQPYAIRPATVLRMPKFNLSPAESAALVDYFAAKDNAQYPYEHDSRTWSEYTMSPDQLKQSATKLDGALKIVTDNNYCVKCHLVGDYVPPGSTAALAPQLDRIADRLRPDYLQKWIANPPMMLPYTGMPVNFPADKPADQKLLAGKAEEQMQSVVDLLLNWSRLLKDQPGSSMKSRVKPPAAAPAAAPATGAAGGE